MPSMGPLRLKKIPHGSYRFRKGPTFLREGVCLPPVRAWGPERLEEVLSGCRTQQEIEASE